MRKEVDFLVIGSGIAGLCFALKAANFGKVCMVTKAKMDDGSTRYAQGGIASVIYKPDTYEKHIQDTMVAGDELSDRHIVELTIREQYRNMLSQIQDKPHIIEIAKQAIVESCGECTVKPIRGGTDGAQLSFMGLPCPNIFAGGLNFHGRHEFVPIQSMEKAMQTIINICQLTAKQMSL